MTGQFPPVPGGPGRSQAVPATSGTGSRETAKNGGAVPGTGSPGPGWSRPVPAQRTAVSELDAVTGSRSLYNREPGTAQFSGSLNDWLTSLKARGLTPTIRANGARLDGPIQQVTTNDSVQLARHHHALEVAAAGTHPDWWNTVLGRTEPHADVELPTVDGDEWSCATCGAPSQHLTADLLPFCHLHGETAT